MDLVELFIAGLASYGIAGLLALAFAERFIPVIPSSAMLASIGAAAADGVWEPWQAVIATVAGGSLGCAVGFAVVGFVGAKQAERLLHAMGASPKSLRRRLRGAAGNRSVLAFSLQLMPTARILAPMMAVFPSSTNSYFHLASFIGIAIWNSVFIGLGYVASAASQSTDLADFVILLLVSLVLVQLMVVYALRRWRKGGKRGHHPVRLTSSLRHRSDLRGN